MKNFGYFKRSIKNPLILKNKSISVMVNIFKFLLIIGLCYLFLFPIFYLALAAFGTANSIEDPSVVWVPKDATLDNFLLAYRTLQFGESLILTSVITIFSTLAAVISCSLVGYGFARFNFPEKKLAFLIVIFMIIVPPQTYLLSSYLQYRFFDVGGLLRLTPLSAENYPQLINTPLVFILPAFFGTGLKSGFFIFIFRQFFLGLPKDLEEAARIDGCNPFTTFIRVIVPITMPAFITVILFSIVWHWNDLYTSTMLFTDSVKPMTAMLHVFQSNLGVMLSGSEMSASLGRAAVSAAALLTIVPPLTLYMFTQRFFVESIERTGIVG